MLAIVMRFGGDPEGRRGRKIGFGTSVLSQTIKKK